MLNGTCFSVLRRMEPLKDATRREIFDELRVSHSRIAGTIKSLLDHGMIVNTGERRQRGEVFAITDAGRDMLKNGQPTVRKAVVKDQTSGLQVFLKVKSSVWADQPKEKRNYEPWVPPKWEAARPGADDHKQFKSVGF